MKALYKGALALAMMSTSVPALAASEALTPWFDKLPQPPKTEVEAQTKVKLEYGKAALNFPELENFHKQLEARKQVLSKQGEAVGVDAEAAGQQLQSDMNRAAGGDLSDPAFVAKLERMSDAEKMAFAMQMSGPSQQALQKKTASGASLAGAETPAVQAAMKTATQYMQQASTLATQQQSQGLPFIQQRRLQAHTALDASLLKDAMTCAAVTDPQQNLACLKAKSTSCWNQHLALAQRQLAETQTDWQKFYATHRKAAVEADQVLAPIQYGKAARSVAGQTLLVTYQGSLLGHADELADVTEYAYVSTAQWSLAKATPGGALPLSIGGSESSCGYEYRFGRSGTGRSGTSSAIRKPADKAAQAVQDGAKKALNWLSR